MYISKEDVENLNRISEIASVKVNEETLTITTKTIQMDNYELGRYKIVIDPNQRINNRIRINNLTRSIMIDHFYEDRTFHHPHTWASIIFNEDTHTCFGDVLEEYIDSLFQAGEYVVIVLAIIQFLQTAYGWHLDERHFCTKEDFLKYWPKVGEEELEQDSELIDG
jgi:hypothetical protein